MSIAERALDLSKYRVSTIEDELYVFKSNGFNGLVEYAEDRLDVAEFILKAVEKQIPAPPQIDTSMLFETEVDNMVCPSCGNYLEENQRYCDNCGQAIKWEE